MTATETKIKECLEPIINNLGYEIYDIIYEKEAKDNYLRIFIDKDEGISLNDCENVNNSVTDILDEKNFIKNSYMLEISSPGIERRIREDKHLEENIGKKVEIHTFKAVKGQKILIGILESYDENKVTIKYERQENKKKQKSIKQNEIGETLDIEKSNIAMMKTVYNWNE